MPELPNRLTPPVAARKPHQQVVHNVTLEDPYHWLRDPAYPKVTDPEILAYLEAENAYFEQEFAPLRPVVDTLFEEIRGRQPEADESVPYRHGAYRYRWRFEQGAEYRIWERAPTEDPEAWSVILDEPALAEHADYFSLGGFSVSPNGRYLAWSADTDGSERFRLSVTDLDTGTALDEPIGNTLDAPVWAADSSHFYYLQLSENWRPYQVRQHQLGTPLLKDRVLYEETDESFFVGIDESQSERWIMITTGDHVTTETHLLPAADPAAEPRLVAPRRTGHEYHLDHREGRFYIRTNDQHRNFRLAVATEDHPEEAAWETFIEGSDAAYLTGHLCFKDALIISERLAGLDQIRVIEDPDGAAATHHIEFPEPSYAVDFGVNGEYEADRLRLVYESMVTPATVYDYQLKERELHTLKVQEIPSGYDASGYESERLMVRARDGVDIPVSLVRRKGTPPGSPLHLYGYGAYGLSMEPGFSASRLSLLDRGFSYAIAHIRGGDDLGYQWYEDGKLDKRNNTFNDFVDVARFLVDSGRTSPARLTISGGSAGGELMGAVVNQAPDLFAAVVAHVPFVDVLNTMLDGDLPLTPIEWPEWGNPLEDPAAFELIQSYSPYDQLTARAYPPMMVTAGLNDPRVTYWEPAKYVAALRHLKTDDSWLLLKTNMTAGHRGQSGRYEGLREVAEEYAFLLAVLGLAAPA